MVLGLKGRMGRGYLDENEWVKGKRGEVTRGIIEKEGISKCSSCFYMLLLQSMLLGCPVTEWPAGGR